MGCVFSGLPESAFLWKQIWSNYYILLMYLYFPDRREMGSVEEIYPITALHKHSQEVRSAAKEGVVRITENGVGAFVFCSEEVFESRLQQAKNDAIYEAELNRALSEAESDFDNGRYVVGFEEAWKRIDELRAKRA